MTPPEDHPSHVHQQDDAAETSSKPLTPEDLVGAYSSLLGSPSDTKKCDQLLHFIHKAKSLQEDKSLEKPSPVVLDPVASKDVRKKMHDLFKGLTWLPPLHTETIPIDVQDPSSGQAIEVSLMNDRGGREQNAGGQGKKRKRRWDSQAWPGGRCRYVRFALYKENVDTHHAITTLSNRLRVSHKVFSVAGTKDKRAVTVQWATAYRVFPSKLAAICRSLRGIRLGNYSFVSEQLRLGDLKGNKFEIILRGIHDVAADTIEHACTCLRQRGFVNYFGLQRFGSSEGSPTHVVGRALLRGRWEEAIRAILQPTPSTRPEIASVCQAFLDGGDASIAFESLPAFLVAERAILSVLANQPKALVNALMAVPKNLRTIYLHAYQSYLWNEAASERILRYGTEKAVAGDLVISRDDLMAARNGRDLGKGGTHHEGDYDYETGLPERAVDAKKEHDGKDGIDVGLRVENNETEHGQEGQRGEEVEVHIVTEEEAGHGKFSIDDVVLPLPGPCVKYPENSISKVYSDLSEKDGVPLDSVAHGVKQLSLSTYGGVYRHVTFRPRDLEFEILKYDDPSAELASTDLEALEGKSLVHATTEGKYMALKLMFTLPPSTYATMLIRELTKMSTEVEHAKKLSHPT